MESIYSDSFDQKIIETNIYLKNLDKSKFQIDYFISQVDKFIDKII